MPLIKSLRHLTGSKDDFSLEYRIFHSFCIVAIVTLIYCIPLNFALNLPISAWISFVGAIFQSFLFYLSRFKKKSKISLVLSIVIIHIILIFNYHYNSGLAGPTLLLLLAIFFLVGAVSGPKEYKYWISLNIIIAVSLPVYEYFQPEQIPDLYRSRLSRFGDMITTYCLSALTILLGLRYIKKNYYLSQELLEAKAEDLEKINQTKNKMFSIVSHDLRAPIASIQNYLELLSLMELDQEDRQQIKQELTVMTQSTDMMLSNLLMWSKSQMEGIVVNKSSMKLTYAIMPVINVLEPIAKKKSLNLTFSIDPDLSVVADKDMLQLVVRNILSNAIKFTHPEGEIHLDAKCENNKCVIIIRDNGIGMDDEVKGTIFSFKAKASFGTKNEKGVGIGLNLSREFIDLQDGDVNFESEPDKGTTFCISLPTGS